MILKWHINDVKTDIYFCISFKFVPQKNWEYSNIRLPINYCKARVHNPLKINKIANLVVFFLCFYAGY